MMIKVGKKFIRKKDGEIGIIREMTESNCMGVEILIEGEDGGTFEENLVWFQAGWREFTAIDKLKHKIKNIFYDITYRIRN